MIQKPTTFEKHIAISIFKNHFLGFNDNYGIPVIQIDDSRGDIVVKSGIEKTGIIPKNFPWVIKCDTYNDGTIPCQIEAKNFQRAISYNLAMYFAPTYYIGKYKGVDLVLQKKLVVDSTYTKSHAYEITGEEIFSPYTINYGNQEKITIYPTWNGSLDQEDILVGLYDNLELVEFCKKYEINDLHDGNFGWDGDQAYITDFSGYHDGGSSYTEDDETYEYQFL